MNEEKTMAKDNSGFSKLDPSVAQFIEKGDRARSERSMPKGERRKAKKAQAKQEARNGSRAVYDLPPELIEKYRRLAAENETTASGIAEMALRYFLRAMDFGEVELQRYKRPLPKNPRYGYEMVWAENE
jgi:hypothetical protein